MKTEYLVYLDDEADAQLDAFLVARGARAEADFGAWWVPDDSRRPVLAELERRRLEFELRYAFSAESADKIDDLAAYLGVDGLEWLPVTSERPLLATEPDDGRLIANTNLLELLGPSTSGLNWQRYEHSAAELWSLTSASELPEPIRIPRALSMVEGKNGLWMVMDDGRSVLTHDNLTHLRTTGIAWAVALEIDGKVLPRPAIPVFGGRVLDLILKSGVDLAIPPLYLIDERTTVPVWYAESEI
jgi:hypothetical protein